MAHKMILTCVVAAHHPLRCSSRGIYNPPTPPSHTCSCTCALDDPRNSAAARNIVHVRGPSRLQCLDSWCARLQCRTRAGDNISLTYQVIRWYENSQSSRVTSSATSARKDLQCTVFDLRIDGQDTFPVQDQDRATSCHTSCPHKHGDLQVQTMCDSSKQPYYLEDDHRKRQYPDHWPL